MKATKALKRLASIEARLADVIERYAATEPATKTVLQDAKAAVLRAKEAVGLQASAQPSTRASANGANPGTKKRVRTNQQQLLVLPAPKKRSVSKATDLAARPAVAKKASSKRVGAKKAAGKRAATAHTRRGTA